jgi:hypothetical protein
MKFSITGQEKVTFEYRGCMERKKLPLNTGDCMGRSDLLEINYEKNMASVC